MPAEKEPIRGRGARREPRQPLRAPALRTRSRSRSGRAAAPRTQFLSDATRSIITSNDSPDVGFRFSLNPYRGCEHACIYCYARPTHEYLGFSAASGFRDAHRRQRGCTGPLAKELSAAKWTPQVLGLSGVTDPYQPIERRIQLTRRCLEVLAKFRNPVAIVTKNHLVTRDADFLGELAQHDAAAVFLSITTLDGSLTRVMEPSAPRSRPVDWRRWPNCAPPASRPACWWHRSFQDSTITKSQPFCPPRPKRGRATRATSCCVCRMAWPICLPPGWKDTFPIARKKSSAHPRPARRPADGLLSLAAACAAKASWPNRSRRFSRRAARKPASPGAGRSSRRRPFAGRAARSVLLFE